MALAYFTGWIKLLYTAPTAMIQTNDITCQPFTLGHGTHQGCPLSPILFDMAIGPLAIAPRDNTEGREQGWTVME